MQQCDFGRVMIFINVFLNGCCQWIKFEIAQTTCSKHYGLDPAHYFTGPGLSWEELLKHSGVRLELLTGHAFIYRKRPERRDVDGEPEIR